MSYTMEEHQHRLAAWAASRAASVKGCRFKVNLGFRILEDSGFTASFSSPASLPSPKNMDRKHGEWRGVVIGVAERQGLKFSHGVAAKLINCYLKVRFVCAGQHQHARVKSLHPPIDEVLLKELAKRDIGGFGKQWRRFRQERWSRFDSSTYESVIDHVRRSLPTGAPLWKIEAHWAGHQ